jgi:putative phosphotransacetylase
LDNSQLIEELVRRALAELDRQDADSVPIGVSARHVHVTAEHFMALFGESRSLKPFRPLNGGQYASDCQVALVSPALKSFENVRIIGPFRKETQVEISRTDARFLKVDPPVRPSGELAGTPGLTLVGPVGSVTIPRGLIIANRHLHLPPSFANRLGLKDNDYVDCGLEGERKTVFCGVQVRVDPSFAPEMHIDADDSNSAGISLKAYAKILKKGDNHGSRTCCGRCGLNAQSG